MSYAGRKPVRTLRCVAPFSCDIPDKAIHAVDLASLKKAAAFVMVGREVETEFQCEAEKDKLFLLHCKIPGEDVTKELLTFGASMMKWNGRELSKTLFEGCNW